MEQQPHAVDWCQQEQTLTPAKLRLVTAIQTLSRQTLKDKLEQFSSCKYTNVILRDKMQVNAAILMSLDLTIFLVEFFMKMY